MITKYEMGIEDDERKVFGSEVVRVDFREERRVECDLRVCSGLRKLTECSEQPGREGGGKGRETDPVKNTSFAICTPWTRMKCNILNRKDWHYEIKAGLHS